MKNCIKLLLGVSIIFIVIFANNNLLFANNKHIEIAKNKIFGCHFTKMKFSSGGIDFTVVGLVCVWAKGPKVIGGVPVQGSSNEEELQNARAEIALDLASVNIELRNGQKINLIADTVLEMDFGKYLMKKGKYEIVKDNKIIAPVIRVQ